MAVTKKKKEKSEDKKSAIKDLLIRVCVGTGGLAAGSSEVIDEFYKELGARGLKAEIEKKCVNKTGCRGFCARDVLVDVILDGNISTYQFIKPEMVSRIVEEHIINGAPVEEWLVGPDYHVFHDKQTKILLKQCGQIDPEDIEAYLGIGGYEGGKESTLNDPV